MKLKPGDYVRPEATIEDDDGHTFDATDKMTPCRVTAVYKNGNIHAASDDGAVTHHGPASGFRKVEVAK